MKKRGRELWEGCIFWDVGDDKIDVRTQRELPQNQEMFVDPSFGKPDADETKIDSFCFDLMQVVDEQDLEKAAQIHWEDLAEQNKLTAQEMSTMTGNITMPKALGRML